MADNTSARARNSLDAFAVALTRVMIRLRWLVIVAALAGAGYLATGASQLEYNNNYRAMFSKENPELVAFETFQATFVKSDNFLFVVAPQDGSDVFSNETLEAVALLTEGGWEIPYATRVDSVVNFQYTYGVDDELIVEDLIPHPGVMSPQELAEKRALALAEPLLNGQAVAPDGRAASVNVTLTYSEQSLSEVPEAVAAARALRDEIEAAYPNLQVYLTGTSMLNNAFSEVIQEDFKTLIPIMAFVILTTTMIAVRSVWATLATFLLVILSAAAAMGWAGFAGIKLAGPSPSSVIVILTLAIADSIHILIAARGAMRRGFEKRAAIAEAMRVNFLAVTITSLTTIVGFLSLNFSDVPPFRDLGNISSVGIFIAWLLSLTLLPALLVVVPFKAMPAAGGKGARPALGALADFVVAHHRKLTIVTGVATLALVAFIPQLELSDQFRKYFAPRIEFRAESDKAMTHFGFYPMEFSVKSGAPGGVTDPEFLKTVDDFAAWLREHPRVRHVYSLADIMKRLNKNLHGDDPAYYSIPGDSDLAAQYLLLFELSLPYGLDLNDRINIDKSETRLTATLDGEVSTREVRALIKASRKWFADNAPQYSAPPTGVQMMFTFIAQRNVESMVRGTILAIVLIAGIMVLSLRSLSIGLLSMVPNGLPILAAFGVWALINGELGFSAAAVAVVSLGIVIDDTVHFLTKYMRGRRELRLDGPGAVRYAFETVGLALIVNTIILLAGFLIFTFSAFKINAELGLFTSLAIAFALVLDFLFLPGMLLMAARRSDARRAAATGA
jgi:predicted RND superfamily exporter protein